MVHNLCRGVHTDAACIDRPGLLLLPLVPRLLLLALLLCRCGRCSAGSHRSWHRVQHIRPLVRVLAQKEIARLEVKPKRDRR